MMILYGITLVPKAEDLRDTDPTLLYPFYTDDAAFDGSKRWSAAQLWLLMDRELDERYFPEPAKSLFIAAKPEDKDVARGGFKWEGLNINFVDSSRYLGVYLGPREELDAWVWPKMEAWDHGVYILAKISKRYPQLSYAGLGI